MNFQNTPVFRVIFASRENYRLLDEKQNIYNATVSGNLRNGGELPAVGDWVSGQKQPGDLNGDWVLIEGVFERTSALRRQDADADISRPQILAANVDVLLIVTSANEDFSLNRLERYVIMAREGGVCPVIVVNKIELAAEPGPLLDEVAARFGGVDVHGVSATEGLNLEVLRSYAEPGCTLALVGSSGVGKSTIVNFLLGREAMSTGGIREDDAKGRHTTTHRELLVAPGGAMVIDTPGLRGVGLGGGAEEAVDSVYGDVQELLNSCRFSDCGHGSEPGCAVQAALASGELSEEHWNSYGKLQREAAYARRKSDKALQADEKRKWARISQNMRARLREKGRK